MLRAACVTVGLCRCGDEWPQRLLALLHSSACPARALVAGRPGCGGPVCFAAKSPRLPTVLSRKTLAEAASGMLFCAAGPCRGERCYGASQVPIRFGEKGSCCPTGMLG